MKAIGIKMVDLKPMIAKDAVNAGYRVSNNGEIVPPFTEGYEVTYPDGYKSWCPRDVADAVYFKLSDSNNSDKINKNDVINFITNFEAITVGEKTTVVNAHTITGFDAIAHSSCVDPNRYDKEIGKTYAMDKVIDIIWGHLGFVLQWAINGLK
jgi:hypothetical protein